MGKIVCEICGNSDFVKSDGLFICESCGTKYDIEEAKKLLSNNMSSTNSTEELNNQKISLGELVEGFYKDLSKSVETATNNNESIQNATINSEVNNEQKTSINNHNQSVSKKISTEVNNTLNTVEDLETSGSRAFKIMATMIIVIGILLTVVFFVSINTSEKHEKETGSNNVTYYNNETTNSTYDNAYNIPSVNCYSYYIGENIDIIHAQYSRYELGWSEYDYEEYNGIKNLIKIKNGQQVFYSYRANDYFIVDNGTVSGMIDGGTGDVEKEIQDAFLSNDFYTTEPLVLKSEGARYLVWKINNAYYILKTYVLFDEDEGGWYRSPLAAIIILKDINQLKL